MNIIPMADRMKGFEFVETKTKFNDTEYLIARVDGRSFSKFTKKLEKPYDNKFAKIMKNTTKYVLDNINCEISYCQSDEATFVFNPVNENTQRFFDGKKMKLTSIISGMFSSKFIIELAKEYPEIFEYSSGYVPHFDCRLFNVPSKSEAINCLLWRVKDAKRNSVSMLAQHYFSHKNLQGKNTDQMLSMLLEKNIQYETYPDNFKIGTFFKKEKIEKIINGNSCIRTEIVSFNSETFSEIKGLF